MTSLASAGGVFSTLTGPGTVAEALEVLKDMSRPESPPIALSDYRATDAAWQGEPCGKSRSFTHRAAASARAHTRRVRERLSPNEAPPNLLVYTPIEDWSSTISRGYGFAVTTHRPVFVLVNLMGG